MKISLRKVLLALSSVGLLLSAGVIIGININFSRLSPVFIVTENAYTLEKSAEGQLVEDNFWRFARASYILIGNPPDCEFYKIVSQVPRHDYDVDSFYIDDESSCMYYHDGLGQRQSKLAIDVSSHQSAIDWEAVKDAGVSVAMIRVGYRGYGTGVIVKDESFDMHISGALDAGLDVGVYFFSQAVNHDEGVEEARYVLNIIENYDISSPVVIDTEYVADEEARTWGLDVDSRTDAVTGFCDTVKAAGYEAMIYSNRNWYAQSLDMTRLGDYRLWVAQYGNQPDFPYKFDGWQYTESGELDGVNGNVDINVWLE